MTGFAKKLEKLNVTIAEGYLSKSAETARLLRDQFVKTPRSSKWCDMHTDKKDFTIAKMSSWSPDPAKLKSSFRRVARHSLPSAPMSRSINQDVLRRCERSSREQTFMCNQAAGLSRCLRKVQDPMEAQLKTLHLDRGKSKASGRAQHAVDKLEYLVTFNRSINQAMAHMMEDLSEDVFINIANLTLARRDSYLDYIRAGVKQDTLNALCNAPLRMQSTDESGGGGVTK